MNYRAVIPKTRCWWVIGCVWLSFLLPSRAADNWPEILARMPLAKGIHNLNPTNCINAMLSAFQSNEVVKALVFLPGATDEFYMFKRAQAAVTNAGPSLWDALRALTNQSRIRVTFREPMLLLHTDEDLLEPEIIVQDERTADQLRETKYIPRIYCQDRDWDFLQPILRWPLKVDIRPWHNSSDSWHFYRHSFSAYGLNGWEALEAAALAGKTRFTVKHKSVIFELDRRPRKTPPA